MVLSPDIAVVPRSAVRSRAIGAGVGSVIGAGWAGYGLSTLAVPAQAVGGVIVLIILALMMRKVRRVMGRARALPAPDATAQARRRRTRTGFILIVVGEIVLLNLAILPLQGPALRVYWIPAIAAVVGLHFLPMAWLFQLKDFLSCGLLMMAAAALAAAMIALGPTPAGQVVIGECIANALILWRTAARSLDAVKAALPPT